MQKTGEETQLLELNKLDFDGAGVKKTNFKFKIEFVNGKVSNIIHDSPLAMELASQLLDNEPTQNILNEKDLLITVNAKYQMIIKAIDN